MKTIFQIHPLISYIRHKDFCLPPLYFGLCSTQGTPWNLKRGGLKSSGQRLISSIDKTKRIFFFESNIFKLLAFLKKKNFGWFFEVFSRFYDFLTIFDNWFVWILRSLRLLLKVTNVTIGHQKWPKMGQNSIISSFFAQRAKKASAKGWSHPQEL